jgi:hypothetical protein
MYYSLFMRLYNNIALLIHLPFFFSLRLVPLRCYSSLYVNSGASLCVHLLSFRSISCLSFVCWRLCSIDSCVCLSCCDVVTSFLPPSAENVQPSSSWDVCFSLLGSAWCESLSFVVLTSTSSRCCLSFRTGGIESSAAVWYDFLFLAH